MDGKGGERRTFMVRRREDIAFGARTELAEFGGVAMVAWGLAVWV